MKRRDTFLCPTIKHFKRRTWKIIIDKKIHHCYNFKVFNIAIFLTFDVFVENVKQKKSRTRALYQDQVRKLRVNL